MATTCAICSANGIETHTDDPGAEGWRRIEHDRDRDGLEAREVWACPSCARLIAAAPDLLAACEMVEEDLGIYHDRPDVSPMKCYTISRRAREAAAAAIRRARPQDADLCPVCDREMNAGTSGVCSPGCGAERESQRAEDDLRRARGE